jgi:hypothetical protein
MTRSGAFIALSFLLGSPLASAQSGARQNLPSPTAVERMSEPGPEAKDLAGRVGLWDVVFTVWPAPGAEPVVTRGLVAERTMIGPFLQEVLRPAPGSATPDFRRIDYLSYDRVEGRWKYVSMDTRFPAGIMPAWSFGGERDGKLTLQFEPLGFVGFGPEVEGRFTRSDLVITRQGANRELKQQHFVQANGTGVEWLAVQYEYTRRR